MIKQTVIVGETFRQNDIGGTVISRMMFSLILYYLVDNDNQSEKKAPETGETR